MICPKCGAVDKSTPVPEITTIARKLGVCKKCGTEIWAIPTSKRGEESVIKSVMEGEKREAFLADLYLQHEHGRYWRKRPGCPDIDMELYDDRGKLLQFFDIKERSCTVNAYKYTKFPYAKIEEGKKLIKEYAVPVYIVLKFADCWARHEVDIKHQYKKGSAPFAPRYRPWQRQLARQVPVLIDVETLEVLPHLCA